MEQLLLEQLQQRPLLCDGAMGTLLYTRGVTYEQCFDELNLTQPELIQSIHREYIIAGAQIIETNTFGANRAKLEAHNLGDQVRKINFRAVKLAQEAREVSGLPVFIAGAVGPSGRPLRAPDEQRLSEIRAIFREQIVGLIEGGADLLILETFSSLVELRQAVLAAKEVGSVLPIVAQMSFYEDGHTLSGQSPARVAAVLNELNVDVIGANCSVGPAATLDVLQEMLDAQKQQTDTMRSTPALFSAQPNAGLPTRIGNRFFYMATPDYFADYALRFADAGVRLIGGCCGTTPRHIAAMRKALDEQYGTHTHTSISVSEELPRSYANGAAAVDSKDIIAGLVEDEVILPPQGSMTRLQEKLAAGDFVVSVELDPPKGLNPTKILEGAVLLQKAGVDCINIADSPMARVRMSCMALARLLRDYLDLESILHFTTRDRNLMALQSDLLGAHALGSHNILALTGDPVRAGNYPNLTGVWDVDSVGLVRILKGMNEGHDAAGASLGLPARFFIGAALNLNMEDSLIDVDQERARRKLAHPDDVAHELWAEHGQMTETELELHRLRHKLDAGAQFIMTQPIYELAPLERLMERFGPVDAPIILGMIPLHSAKHAEYLHNEVPGMSIPDEVRARMREAGERGREVGIALARDIITQARARGLIQGCYLMPSYGRYDLVGDLARELLEG